MNSVSSTQNAGVMTMPRTVSCASPPPLTVAIDTSRGGQDPPGGRNEQQQHDDVSGEGAAPAGMRDEHLGGQGRQIACHRARERDAVGEPASPHVGVGEKRRLRHHARQPDADAAETADQSHEPRQGRRQCSERQPQCHSEDPRDHDPARVVPGDQVAGQRADEGSARPEERHGRGGRRPRAAEFFEERRKEHGEGVREARDEEHESESQPQPRIDEALPVAFHVGRLHRDIMG